MVYITLPVFLFKPKATALIELLSNGSPYLPNPTYSIVYTQEIDSTLLAALTNDHVPCDWCLTMATKKINSLCNTVYIIFVINVSIWAFRKTLKMPCN